MYNWSIGESEIHNWRFSIKAADRTIVDLVPILDLHIWYRQNPTLMNYPRFGEIYICHRVEDSYLEYADLLNERNPPECIMELRSSLTSEITNVFTRLTLHSMNYLPFNAMPVVESRWLFAQSAMLLNNEMIEDESELVTRVLNHAEFDSTAEQKLDWRQFGF